MICGTCGKNNADHLVFCEDCGARVVKEAGLKFPRCHANNAAGMRFCITCGSPLDPAKAGPAPHVSVPAPAGGIAGTAPMPAVAPLLTPQPAPAPPAVAPAPPLHPAPVALIAPIGTVAMVPPPAPPAPPIAPSPVVGLGPAPTGKPQRICARCKGSSDAESQFCRFCGAPLAGATADARPLDGGITKKSADAPAARLDRTQVTEPPLFDSITVKREEKLPLEATSKIQPYQDEMKLQLIAKDGSLGPSHPIGAQLDIGRSEGDVVLPEDRYLAPRHARLKREESGLTVRDLGSPNGVFLRVRRAGPSETGESPLRDGDLILIGQQVLRFEVVKDGDEGLGAASEQGTLLFGTPITPRYARLGQVTTEGVVRDVYYLRKAETILGRESGDIVFTEDPFLSRRHATIKRGADKSFALGDLDSSNGTFLRIRGTVTLKHGDEIRVGQQLFRIDSTSTTSTTSMSSMPAIDAAKGGS
ncbi:hypothetical protein BH09MYX1_BH09MYX1_61680 [soil metagenome]